MKIVFYILVILTPLRLLAQEAPPPKAFEYEGLLRGDFDLNPTEAGALRSNFRFQKFEFQVSLLLAQNVPHHILKQAFLVVRSRMEQDIVVNGSLDINHLSFVDYLKELYLVLDGVFGLPISFKIGTTEVPFGQDFDGTLSLQNDANHPISDPDRGQVKQFAVVLDKSVKNLFDKAEFGVFTSNGRLTTGGLSHFDGMAFRITKDVSEHLVVEVSFLHRGNAFDPSLKPDSTFSAGGVYRKGRWTAWGEGFGIKNSQVYPNATWAGTGGISRITGPGRLTCSSVKIQNTLTQYAFGYDIYASKDWTFGPTGRFTACVGGNAGCMEARGYGQGVSIGISVRRTFGVQNENPTWWGRKGAPKVLKAFVGSTGARLNTVNHPTGSTELLTQ